MDKEEVQNISFKIISYAGDAFSYFYQAVEKAREGELEEADEFLKMGKKQMAQAHTAQTELLTAEAQGNDIAYSIIMVHAQDHLMMTVLYERIAREFVEMYRRNKQ